MTFELVDQWVNTTLDLPAKGEAHPDGRTYRVPSPPAEDGLWLLRLFETALDRKAGNAKALNDQDERNLYQRCLGPVFDEALADGVPWVMVKHMALTAFQWHVKSLEAAQRYWAAPSGEAQSPSPTTSTGTGEASTTSGRAPGSGTTPPSTSSAGTSQSKAPQ